MNPRLLLAVITISITGGCCRNVEKYRETRIQAATNYFESVYAGKPTAIRDLTADDIRVSYPIFEKLFDSSVIQGWEAVEGFAERFSRKWGDPEIEIKKVIVEGNSVVLVWNFKAFDLLADSSSSASPQEKASWGGITYLQFNTDGKIELEIGEESTPGPFGRLARAGAKG